MSSGCHCLDKVACVKVGCNELDLSVHSQGVVINSMKPRNFASGDRSVVPPHDLFVCANVVVRQDDQLDGSTVVLVVLMKGSKDCWEEHCEASKSGSAAQLVDLAAPHIDTNIDSSAALKTRTQSGPIHQVTLGVLTLERRSGSTRKRPWLGCELRMRNRTDLLELGHRECL